jgi:SAM-dependent methyltransferase
MSVLVSTKAYWNKKYAERKFDPGVLPAAALIGAKEELLARQGRVLDLACGEGGNAVYLAKLGFRVEGVDISLVGLLHAKQLAASKGVRLDLWVADLSDYPLPSDRYDLILNINFLMRTLIKPIDHALKPGGLLIFQTYTREDSKFGRDRYSHPEYYLYPRELLGFFPEYRVWYYYEGSWGERQIASLIAEKPPARQSTG